MYAEPLEVWDALEETENRSESFTGVSSGEQLELQEEYLIQNSFTTANGDQDVYILENGSLASPSDYEVDLRDGKVTWNGTGGVDLKIRYKTAPVANSVVLDELKAATQKIDRRTGTTFNGKKTVTHTYDIPNRKTREVVLFDRPVRSLNQVRINQAETGSTDNFKTLDLGRSGDVFLQDDLSIAFTKSFNPEPGAAKLEVEYTYGYSNIPDEIKKLAMTEAAQSLMENTILGEVLDGRDDFTTQLPAGFINEKEEVFSSWTIERMGEPIPRDV